MLNFNHLASRINLNNCRISPRNNFIRCNWIPFIAVILISLVTEVLFAQTMILKPPSAQDSDGDYEIKLLLKQDAEFRLEWTNLDASVLNLTGSNAKLIIGRASNTYQTLEIDVDGNQADLVPNTIGLSVGRYFARITNSTARSASTIQEDATNNPGSIFYSNEVQIIVEADEAPSIIAPRGNTTNATPTFQWTAVSGVPSYWLIVSSTPFDIVEDDEGGISIEGATVVWQYITKTTTADYGDINRESPFTDEAPPLNANQEYSYTVLNVYEENNPVYTSPVFGGIVPFVFVDPNAVPKTTLVRPNNNVELFAEETITFEWTDVPEAANYTVNLFQVMKQQGIDVTIPIWSGATTNNLMEFPALQTLKSGRYQWNVVSNNTKGGGTTSNSRFFQYNVETGEFSARVLSAADNSSLLGVELSARAISGGVTPSLPYFVQTESYSDSLVAGTYEFTAEKQGFEITSTTAVIEDQRTTYVQIKMEPLPSSLSGVVKDNAGETVEDAVVNTVKSDDGTVKTTTTGVNGDYSISLNQGSYTVSVSKSGYISPSSRSVTLGLDEQKNLSDPFILTNDQATVSGTIFNEDGDAISRATVRIDNGSQQYEAQSNGSGAYQFTVSSGNWTLSVEKIGFVKPEDATVSLSTGDILQSQDFTLIGNANQVTGFVRERITNGDGSTGLSPFGNVEVRAVPSVGTAISTTTSGNGQYTLSLKSGSYSIVAIEENYASNQERELVIGIAVGETISGMDFEMVPNASSISGTVSLPNGNGVSDATVTVLNVGTAQTNSSGYYSMSAPNGSHEVSVNKTGLVSPSPKTISLSAGQDLTGINFEMTPNAGSISGKVSSSGLALTNSQLRARNTSTSQLVTLTNANDGGYTFNLQSGSWIILAQKTGFLSDSSAIITIGPGQSVINQNFSLVENTFTLRGTVTDGTNAIRNASVSVSDGEGFSQVTQTQINGTYAFSIPAGVNYTMMVDKDGYKSASDDSGIETAGSTSVKDFALSSNPSSVAGTVSVSGGGILDAAKIYALNESGQKVDSTTSKSDGTYVLGLNPNSYTLRAQKAGYTNAQKTTTLSIGQNLTGVNFSVSENFVFISGTLTDTEENTLDQVLINANELGGSGATAVSDAEGAYSFEGLVGGSYVISYSKTGYVSKEVAQTASDGATIRLDQQLTIKDGRVSGLVQDLSGARLAEATVTATHSNGNVYTNITNTQGEYSLISLELGNYTINATKTGYSSPEDESFTLGVDETELTQVNVNGLVLNNAGITGTIAQAITNAGIKGAEISLIGREGNGSSFTVSEASGTYAISGMSPGNFLLITSKEGFESDTTGVLLTAGMIISEDVQLSSNISSLSGIVTDKSGNTLGFNVMVIASNNANSYTTKSDESGNFQFNEIENRANYTLETDIYREGYENGSLTYFIASGESAATLSENLEVTVTQASITGTAGVAGATMRLINADTQEIVDLVQSNPSGNYSFTFLPAGNYFVQAQLLGYEFSPAQRGPISLGNTTLETANFTAEANIATLDVKVLEEGEALSNVDVSIISADTTIVISQKSGSDGIARFSGIKATSYTIRATKTDFTSDPALIVQTLQIGDSTTVSFSMISNNAQFSGSVVSSTGNGLSDVDVQATLESTGQSFTALSNDSGQYNFDGVASGTYQLKAQREGFTQDSLEVTLVDGDNKTVDDLVLSPRYVDVRGKVLLRSAGFEGASIRAQSSSSISTISDADGNYRFGTLPISIKEGDSTTYQFTVSSGVFSKTYTRVIKPDQVTQQIVLPDTYVPSGQITIRVNDGKDPLPGTELVFGVSGGQSQKIITGNDGVYASESNLKEAEYTVSLFKEGHLYPENTIRISLDSDTTVLDSTFSLPYVQLPVGDILADQSTAVSVVSPAGLELDNTTVSAQLYYRVGSTGSFQSLSMQAIYGGEFHGVFSQSAGVDTLRATIPVLGGVEPITLYTSVRDIEKEITYQSNQKTITPLASGILSTVRITPGLKGKKIRLGDTYDLRVELRDGINKSLQDKFEGETTEGTVQWSLINNSSGIQLSTLEGTQATLETLAVGTYQFRVTTEYNGTSISETIDVEIQSIPIDSMVVSRPAKQISNASTHLFGYTAIDTSGSSVVLGNSLEWKVNPSTVGTVDNRGVFTPTNNSTIGSFTVEVIDPGSGIQSKSDVVELVARILPEETYTLTNGTGMQLSLAEGSVEIPSQLSLGETTPPTTKKFVFAQGKDISYTVSDQIYILSFSGSPLMKEAVLTLPDDTTMIFNTGIREIGRFNFTTLQWELMEATQAKHSTAYTLRNNVESAGTVSISSLGQFAVMVENEPLGIKYAAVLPSPFSPEIAPLRLGYWLDSAYPPVKVDIQIINMKGELVRTLLEDDLQQPGRYGSASSQKELLWDGKTDRGTWARNGRYIIQIKAKDQSAEVVKLLPVVLIK